jgi:hypothetical protein
MEGNVKTILALLMIMLSATAYGQLVKCTTKDGKVIYANSCPPDTTEQQIRSAPASSGAGAPPAAQKSLAERDADFKKRMIEKQEMEQKEVKKLAEAQQKREACEGAQAYLKSLESGIRIQRTDPKTGERIYMEDEERASETVRARARVEQACK